MKKMILPYFPELAILSENEIIELLYSEAEQQSIDCVNWPETFPYQPSTTFFAVRDDISLHVLFKVKGQDLKASCSDDLSCVWTDSCVELFVKSPGSKLYYNFEFNCIGTCYAARRESRENFTLFNVDELKQIRRRSSLGNLPFDLREGVFEWTLLISIPFSLMGVDVTDLPESLFANFYKCADGTNSKHYVSWNPIFTEKPDFHRPEFFGQLLF